MAEDQSTTSGLLYVVSTPIGNPDDITLRAVAVMQTVDVIVCESRAEAQKLLAYLGIVKELLELNEHNDAEATIECMKLLGAGKKLALISDAGTPVIADPGGLLVAAAIRYGYTIHVVPGPSSILAALVRSGMPTEQFLYVGFLSRKREQRQQQVRLLALEPRTLVMLDTPYRLNTVLSTLAEEMPQRRAYVGCNLTLPNESHHYGTLAELHEHFTEHRFRGEYVIVIEGNPSVTRWYEQLTTAQAESATAVTESTQQTPASEAHPLDMEYETEASAEEEVQTPPSKDRRPQRGQPHQKRHYHSQHHQHRPHQRRERYPSRQSPHNGNRYDYEQPIVNYTLSNPYQQHPPIQRERPPQHTRRPKKRWRR